ncbi:hypothetical protein C1701_14990 [Actinoalloteichus sp. AHMU CJ021]|uniref:ESX secretion-associated protein EspG n=1 Tax=Actinoalloteichus sp. AHMU CJ021 TaxID=2072503 RepID=UPI000CA02AD0|nr:hypothetical protein C1701_14990 [Actinoalloteichus sp. AHMU CJ021]
MTVSPRGRITLPAIAVDVIQTRLRATLPAALKTVGFGSTEDERRMLHQRAWQELEARGLVRTGDLDPFLEDAFQILARPPLAVWALLQTDRENGIDAVIAASGDFAVLAMQSGPENAPREEKELVLEAVRPTGLAHVAASLLPEHRPGKGQSVSCPSDLIEKATANASPGPGGLRASLTSHGMRPGEAEFIAEVLTSERLRYGEFSTRSFNRLAGKTTRSAYRVDVLDTSIGRYLLQHKPDGQGRPWFAMAPTDRTRMAGRIQELITSVTT